MSEPALHDGEVAEEGPPELTMPADPDPRLDQMFPSLSPEEIDRLRRFGTIRRYAAGEPMFTTGEIGSGMFVLVSGTVAVSARDGLGHVIPIIELGPGGFLAEVGMLAGQPRLVDARATSDTEVLLVPADRLRTVLIAEAEIGERIMRALLLRRLGLIETGGGGPVLIGPAVHPDLDAPPGLPRPQCRPASGGRSRRRSRGRRPARALRGT